MLKDKGITANADVTAADSSARVKQDMTGEEAGAGAQDVSADLAASFERVGMMPTLSNT